MRRYNKDALRAVIIKNGMSAEETAEKMGVSRAHFYRKMRDGSWTMKDALRLADMFNMTATTFNEIFYCL